MYDMGMGTDMDYSVWLAARCFAGLKLSTSIRRAQNVGATAHEGEELGSDGECHGEDDEVRSLSLSEDGPVIRRTLSEPSTCPDTGRQAAAAPDPIAMLTDGTCTASSALSAEAMLNRAVRAMLTTSSRAGLCSPGAASGV